MSEKAVKRRDRLMWANDEDIFISENAGILTAREIGEKLGRTERAVRNRAQLLFISVRKSDIYTLYEKNLPVFEGSKKECAEFWGVTEGTIRYYASDVYLKRIEKLHREPDMARIAVRI